MAIGARTELIYQSPDVRICLRFFLHHDAHRQIAEHALAQHLQHPVLLTLLRDVNALQYAKIGPFLRVALVIEVCAIDTLVIP